MSVRPTHRVAAVAVVVVALGTAGQLSHASATDLLAQPVSIATGHVVQTAVTAPVAAAPSDLSVAVEGTSARVFFLDQTSGAGQHVISYGTEDDVQMLTLAPGVDRAHLDDLQGSSEYVLVAQSIVEGRASKVSTVRFQTP